MSIRVMIIEDSAIMRKLLTAALEADPDIEVVGAASGAEVAWTRIQRLRPDVLTLDLHLGPDDGVILLKKIMSERPTPTVVVSALGQKGSRHSVAALTAGALFVVAKPSGDSSGGAEHMTVDLRTKVKLAALASVRRIAGSPPPTVAVPEPIRNPGPVIARPLSSLTDRGPELIAIGTSTGGAAALARILPTFAADSPPIVIVDHMPPGYTDALAKRLDAESRLNIREACDNEQLRRGQVRIAPGGDRHLIVVRFRNELRTALICTGPTDGHCPSVTELFASVADAVGPKSSVALLTGMGRDGADGLLQVRKAGGFTITQDESSSVVYGMPKAGFELGASMAQVSLDDVPAYLQRGHAAL